MASEKCIIGSEAAEKINYKKIQIDSIYFNTFGPDSVGIKPTLFGIKKFLTERKQIIAELNSLQKSGVFGSRVTTIEKQLKAVNKKLSDLGVNVSGKKTVKNNLNAISNELKKKEKVLKEIKSLITGRLEQYMDMTMYQMNPDKMFPTMKRFITEQYTVPFNNLMDLDTRTLISIKNTIKSKFDKADKAHLASLKGKKKSVIERIRMNTKDTIYDPAMAMLESDVSMMGYKLVNRSRESLDNAHARSTVYKKKLTDALQKLSDSVSRIDADSATKQDLVESLVDRAHKILDGQERYFVPKPVAGYINGVFRVVVPKADYKEYKKRIDDAISMDINDGGSIKKIVVDGKTMYYTAIEQPPNDKGQITYNVYEVPHVKSDVGKDRLVFLNRDNVSNWKDNFSRPGLAPTVNKFGDNISGIMQEGYYRATDNKVMQGTYIEGDQKGETFSFRSYVDFEMIEDQSEISSQLNDFIKDTRSVLEEVRKDVQDSILQQEGLLKMQVTKAAKAAGVTVSKFLSSKELNETFHDALNLDSLNLNFKVVDGKIVTMNHQFNERNDYVPYRYEAVNMLIGLSDAISDIQKKIEDKQSLAAAYSNQDDVESLKAKLQLAEQIEDLNGQLEILNDKFKVTTGELEAHDSDHSKINAVTKINAVKTRTTMMDPMPSYITKDGKITRQQFDPLTNKENEQRNSGRRTDFNVFTEYLNNIFKQVENNGLKIDLLEAINSSNKETGDFLVDHIKASMGRLDVQSGLLGFDYSDTRIKNIFKTVGFDLTERDIYRKVKVQSMLISRGLLGMSSALNNNAQRLSILIDKTTVGFKETKLFMESNSGIADQIADAAGVTDTLVAMADALFGAVGQEINGFGDYVGTIGAYGMLKLSKNKFTKKALTSKIWTNRAQKMIERKNPGQKVDNEALIQALGHIHSGVNGMIEYMNRRGVKLDAKGAKAFVKDLSNIMEDDEINKFVGFGLKGGFLTKIIPGSKIFSFTDSELEMRKEFAVHAALEAERNGLIPADFIERYKDAPDGRLKILTHPNALAYSRILVYNTLFGLSPAYLPKAFRGAFGNILFKFKPYQWNQMRNEYRTIRNWTRSGGTLDNINSIGRIMSATLNPDKSAFNKLSLVEQKVGRYFASRVLISTIFEAGMALTGLRAFIKTAIPIFGERYIINAVQRGGESVIFSAIARSVFTGLSVVGVMSDEDEEDKLYQSARRIFLPMAINVLIDSQAEDDPFKVVGLYSKGAKTIIDAVRKGLSE